MQELKILGGTLHSRSVYETLKELGGTEDFGDRSQIIFNLCRDQYERDQEQTAIDVEILLADIDMKYPRHADNLKRVVTSLEKPSIPNLIEAVLQFRKSQIYDRMAGALVARNDKEVEECRALLEKIVSGNVTQDDTPDFFTTDISAFQEEMSEQNKIKLFPNSLNMHVGNGVVTGTHLLVYARPETGKSTFCINMAGGFLSNNKKVVYFGNEDPARVMMMRFYSCLTGWDSSKVLANPDEAKKKAYSRGLENLYFVDKAICYMRDVRIIVEKVNPDVIILDQLHNIKINKEMSKVDRLEELAREAREIGKDHNALVVSATQAAETAHNKEILEMTDVYYSNVGIQAHLDIMVGMGLTDRLEANGMRMLSTPKNKPGGGNHGYFPIRLVPQIARCLDV